MLALRAGEGAGPLAVVATIDGASAFVAAFESGEVVEMGLGGDRAVRRRIAVGGPPTALALTRDGKRLLVTVGLPEGWLAMVDTATGAVAARIPIGHTPTGVAVDAAGTTAWVCERFRDRVAEVDLAAGRVRAVIPVRREPVACVLSADGATLAVTNLLPVGPADTGDIASEVSLVRVADRTLRTVRLPDGSSSARGIGLSADGRHAYVAHTLGRYTLPTTQLERGWLITNVVSIVDVAAGEVAATVLLDAYTQGAANPWGVAVSPDGATLAVTSAGTHEVHRIDLATLHATVKARLAPPPPERKGPPVTAASERERLLGARRMMTFDFTVIDQARRRIALPGNGPRGVAWAGTRMLVAEFYSDSLAVVEADGATVAAAPVIEPVPMSRIRRGEMFFHDASFCFQQWLSCTTCHPNVRTDGLNWDLLNDGLGNAKQTKNMLWGHRFPPAMLLGARGSAEHAIRKGLQVIQFSQRSEEDAMDIELFLKSLQPVPSPFLVDGTLSAAAERGRVLYDRAGCNTCHPLPEGADRRAHDVGTASPLDQGKAYDTPTLIETWRNGPWLGDGRAATMLEVLRRFNPEDKHGRTSGLSDSELADLAEFVLSL